MRGKARVPGIAAASLLALFAVQGCGGRGESLEFEFHEGTDMEAAPSPDGRFLALQLWSQIWILEERSEPWICGWVDARSGEQASLPVELSYEIPRAATTNAAAALGVEGRLGCIEPGAAADLLVLDGDPLEDIRNTQKIFAMVQGGRIVDRGSLLKATDRN